MSTAGEIHRSALDSDRHYNNRDKRDLFWHCLEYKSFIVLFLIEHILFVFKLLLLLCFVILYRFLI